MKPPPIGRVSSRLEETFVETSRVNIQDFGARAVKRSRYEPAAGDVELLRDGPLSFDGFGPEEAPSGPHPLRSMQRLEDKSSAMRRSVSDRSSGQLVRCNHMEDRLRHEGDDASTSEAASFSTALAAVLSVGSVLLHVAFFEGPKKRCVFELHGDQTLAELAAVLRCSSGAQLVRQHAIAAKLQQPGGPEFALPSDATAFCIEGCWYWHGGEDGSDLSASVREWLAQRSGVTPELLPMATTTLSSLGLHLGRQYLFVHHGDCEHSVVFTRCALATSADVLGVASYPRTVWINRPIAKRCMVCCRSRADWECFSDLEEADTGAPYQLCHTCHYQAHYDQDGYGLRFNYKAFPLVAHPLVAAREAAREAAGAMGGGALGGGALGGGGRRGGGRPTGEDGEMGPGEAAEACQKSKGGRRAKGPKGGADGDQDHDGDVEDGGEDDDALDDDDDALNETSDDSNEDVERW